MGPERQRTRLQSGTKKATKMFASNAPIVRVVVQERPKPTTPEPVKPDKPKPTLGVAERLLKLVGKGPQ